ncbi:hypothetical protein MalM25_09350 [Planctomycetes bacterium MalM25]|nr:hypothetical protein MalM25_09350 [Planctomycetes bacterium MalM25]
MYRDANQREFARRLRREMTDAERVLWRALRCKQLEGLKFRRQAAIGDYIVDFVCFEKQLVVELDGGQHNEPKSQRYDEQRTRWLESQGYRVLRYWNHEVLGNVEPIIESLWDALAESGSQD